MKNKYRFEDGTVYFLDSSSTLKMVSISRDQEWTFRLDWRGKTFPVNATQKQTGTPPGDVYFHWTITALPGIALKVPMDDKFTSIVERADAIRETAEAMKLCTRHYGPLPGEIPHVSVSLAPNLEAVLSEAARPEY